MAYRTKLLPYGLITSAIAGIAGCNYSQQSKFQTSFLPAAPHPAAMAASVELTPPPVVPPNQFLPEGPALFTAAGGSATVKSRNENLLQSAEQHFQRGRKYYQAKD